MGWTDHPDAVESVLKRRRIAFDRMVRLGRLRGVDADPKGLLLAVLDFLQWEPIRPSREDARLARHLLQKALPNGRATWRPR